MCTYITDPLVKPARSCTCTWENCSLWLLFFLDPSTGFIAFISGLSRRCCQGLISLMWKPFIARPFKEAKTHLNLSCSESRTDRCHFIAHINRQMLQQSTVLITITPCIISKSSLVNLHLYSLCIYSTFSTFWTPHSHNGSLPPEPVI